MKVVVTGTRGIPGILGGVETHCEELYPRIAAMGHEITVIRRACYVKPENKLQSYRGVRLKDVYAPRKKSLEAIIHTLLAVIEAKRQHPDILHIHAIGPSIMVPFARLLGLKVVTTNHGPDYDRKKWGKLAKFILHMGECFGAKYSNEVIVISEVISGIIARKYGKHDTTLIYNGVPAVTKSESTSYIDSLGISRGKYVFAMGRFVEEKGFDLLIKAFSKANISEYQLVIAGDADHNTRFCRVLKDMAAANSSIILPGFVKGEKLNQLLTNASLFVLPSFHEGLPIALLEAMSYNLPVLVSDIPANCIPELSKSDYFKTGDLQSLILALKSKLSNPVKTVNYDLGKYNWDNIAEQTVEVYKNVLNAK